MVIIQALSMASDEIHWLIRHKEHNPPKGKKNPEEYVDVLVTHKFTLISTV